jgi:hypothetical protein
VYSVRIEDGESDPELQERTVISEPLGSLRGMLDCLYQRVKFLWVDQSLEFGPLGVIEGSSLINSNDAMTWLLGGQDVVIRLNATREELVACLGIQGVG